MVGVLFGLYGLVSYLFFFAVFLYAIAFVGDLPVPKTIDSGPPGALIPSLLVNALLLGLFAVQHSVMARPAFKRWWTKIVPPPVERSTYVLFASLALVVLFLFWRPLPQPVWMLAPGLLATALKVVFWAGWAIVLLSTFLLSHFELFGLQQVWNRMRNQSAGPSEFRTPLFYRLVRHPLYLGFILAFWAAPVMTIGHLEFAIATLGYILIAIQLEERDLVGVFGDRYLAYRGQVGMLCPRLTPAKPPVEPVGP
jgi:protein-S-isoprenylcysteine O-methyltransferase Ste14